VAAVVALVALVALGPTGVVDDSRAEAQSATTYTYVNLGVLGDPGGGGSSAAWAVNNAELVAGASTTTVFGAGHAFRWQNGILTDLGVIGGGTFAASAAYGVNNAGDIVGQTTVTTTDPPHAFLHRGGVMSDLGTGFRRAGGFSRAWDINARSQIVGERAASQSAATRAFLWQNGRFRDLGTLGGQDGPFGTSAVAHAVNDQGQVVGTAMPPNPPLHAFIWERGTMEDLGTLGGNQEATQAFAINNAGQVVGSSPTTQGDTHAVPWDDGSIEDLGTLGGDFSTAYGINADGDVVGGSAVSGAPFGNAGHAFLWANGQLVDLNDVVTNLPAGVALETARAINDDGYIVGTTCGVICEPGITPLAGAFLLVPSS
jgi:probable HAF family extracellular repeat protein